MPLIGRGHPSMLAGKLSEVDMLVNTGANIEPRDRFGATPLNMPKKK